MDNKEEIIKLAGLAKINLNEKEVQRLGADLKTIMQKFSELDAYDVSDVQPLISPSPGFCPVREDEVKDQAMAAKLLANAPDTDEDKTFFAVPKVIEA